VAGVASCTVNSAKSRFILAEKLFKDGKYAASVQEFERVAAADPKGKLGVQALYRAASTQMNYLNQYPQAVRNFREFIEANGEADPASWEVKKQLGEILFAKLEQYDQAIAHYEEMLKGQPSSSDAAEFYFRVGRSQFFRYQFNEAVETFRSLERLHPTSPFAPQAAFEVGSTYFTMGEQTVESADAPPRPAPKLKRSARTEPESLAGEGAGGFREAIRAYEAFIRKYPSHPRIPEAHFGIANCLEELDQLDKAFEIYEAIKTSFPSPQVIQIKLIRIRERQAQRGQIK